MVVQLLPNINEMLQYVIVPNSKFSAVEFGHLDMAKVCKDCLGAQAGHRSVVSLLVSLLEGNWAPGSVIYRRIVHVVVVETISRILPSRQAEASMVKSTYSRQYELELVT
jgi:elongation factor P hydroxylase